MARDPFAWPVRLSEEILKYPEKVDPEFYRSAFGYQKKLQPLVAEGMTSTGAAQLLQKQGIRLHGWSKSIITKALYPAAGPSRVMPGVPPSFDPGFISRWNREALLSRLGRAVEQGPYDPVSLKHFYRGIAGRAGKFGVEKDLLSKLGPSAPQMLQDIISPPSIGVRASRVFKSIRGLPRGYKIGMGAAVGLLGLYALQPGSYFNGFQEQGEAQKNRRFLTDFGSGYRGLDLSGDKTISPVERRFGKFASTLRKYGVEVGTAHKRIYIPKDIISEEELTEELGFLPVKIAIPEAGQTRFESFRHRKALFHLHEHEDAWVMHEDTHPAATMSVRNWMEERAQGLPATVGRLATEIFAGIKHTITEGIPGAYYYTKGLISDTDIMRQRISEEISPKYRQFVDRIRKEKRWTESSVGKVWSGFGKEYNTIEGLFHGGEAGRKRRELTDFGSGWRGLFGKVFEAFGKKKGWSISAAELRAGGVGSTNLSKGTIDFYKQLHKGGAISRAEFKSIRSFYKGKPLAARIAKGDYELVRRKLIEKGVGFKPITKDYAIAREWGRTEAGQSGEWLQVSDPLDELMKKLGGGSGTGSVSISGFSESGISASSRKTYGFGSPKVLSRIINFARKVFRNPKSESAFERLISPASPAQIETIFGKEVASFNPRTIRSGKMDAFFESKRSAAQVIEESKRLSREQEEMFERLIGPIAPHKQAQAFGKGAKELGAEELKQLPMDEIYRKMKFKTPEARGPKGFEDKVQRMLAADKADRLARQQPLHNQAQKQLWSNSVGAGRGHISGSANLPNTVVRSLPDTLIRPR